MLMSRSDSDFKRSNISISAPKVLTAALERIKEKFYGFRQTEVHDKGRKSEFSTINGLSIYVSLMTVNLGKQTKTKTLQE